MSRNRSLAARRLKFVGCIILLALCSACANRAVPVVTTVTTTTTTATTSSNNSETEDPNRVLRHAVFFKFKDESSKEDVKNVVDAFRSLPSKIDSITDFQWGTNNSPEKMNDEFTHCFLLTFKDEAGRGEYLPHAAHKAFGDVLRPHMEKVFVIDYWGTKSKNPLEKELKHAVFFKFKDEAAAADIEAAENAFADLPVKIDAIKRFEWGKNNSGEKHDDGFTHCFMVTFDSEAGRGELWQTRVSEEQ